jgi:hypothetical protein
MKEDKKMKSQRTGFRKAIGLMLALVMVCSLIPTMDAQASILDEMDTAVGFEYGTNISQTIDSSDDADWFYFQTNDYAEFYTIQVSNQTSVSGNNLAYYIYDANGNPVDEKHYYGKGKSGTEYFKFSKSATYFIKFYNYSSFKSLYEYVFNISCEKEDADDIESAELINYEAVYAGDAATADDKDYFSFRTNDYAEFYAIQVTNQSEVNGNRLCYRICDENGNYVQDTTHTYNKAGSGTEYFKLSKNATYYIEFYSSLFKNRYEYIFNVKCEKEDADDADSAEKISFNELYTGDIVTTNDEDWFKIVTPKYTMSYSLQVSNQSEKAGIQNRLGCRVYDSEMTCLSDKTYGRLKSGTEELVLSAGKTYYVQFYSKGSFVSCYEYNFKLIAKDIDFVGVPLVSKVSATSKGFKATWKKGTDATGYQIRYSTKKNMKNAKTVNVSSTSKKITKLKAKTKYYVQVRAYAKLSTGKKLYSKWSNKSTVTTKK